jgi:hypothetical protein
LGNFKHMIHSRCRHPSGKSNVFESGADHGFITTRHDVATCAKNDRTNGISHVERDQLAAHGPNRHRRQGLYAATPGSSANDRFTLHHSAIAQYHAIGLNPFDHNPRPDAHPGGKGRVVKRGYQPARIYAAFLRE